MGILNKEYIEISKCVNFLKNENMKKYKIPIGELFEILQVGKEYETVEKSEAVVKILSPTGQYVPVNAFVKKHHDTAKFKLENNTSIECSIDHLVFEDGKVTKISQCQGVDTLDGSFKIIERENLGFQDVFDVALDYPHQYVTPNKVIHHNTSLAKVIVNELEIDDWDFLEINASRDNSVDFIREKVEGFCQTMPFGKFKIILLDECLEENTLVTILRNGIIKSVPIKDVDDTTDLVKSYDIEKNCVEWMPFQKMDKGDQETFEIDLDNGDKVTCTASHKWYVLDEKGDIKVVRTDELGQYMHILSPIG
jgi:DNA polymerase III delta prime subunit